MSPAIQLGCTTRRIFSEPDRARGALLDRQVYAVGSFDIPSLSRVFDRLNKLLRSAAPTLMADLA